MSSYNDKSGGNERLPLLMPPPNRIEPVRVASGGGGGGGTTTTNVGFGGSSGIGATLSNNNNHNSYNYEGTPTTKLSTKRMSGPGTTSSSGAAAGTEKIKSVVLDSKRNMFAKQSRPRKAVAEFRKKSRQVPNWTGRVGVHVKVDEINIEPLTVAMEKHLEGWKVVDHYDVVRLWQAEPPYIGHELWQDFPLSDDEQAGSAAADTGGAAIDYTAAMPEIYAFSFGAVVFWNFPNAEYEERWMEENIFKLFPDSYGDQHTPEEMESGSDTISFQYGEKFALKRDVCTLTTRDAGEKLAVSFAFAKSSLLSIYELRVQRLIERNSHIPEQMVKNGRIKMSSHDMSREIGRLFLVKHGINLDQSLIDTPEEFWEDDRFEPTYDTALKYFEISKRLTLLNNRLDMIGELHNKIMEENQTHHAAVLEWIIILLIVVEVVLDVFHLGFY